jgi:hypothetical protein
MARWRDATGSSDDGADSSMHGRWHCCAVIQRVGEETKVEQAESVTMEK